MPRFVPSLNPKLPRFSSNERLAIGAGYLAAFSLLALWAHRGWPHADASSLWFYSAGIAVLLAAFVVEPFYTSPKTAFGNGFALALVVLTAGRTDLQASKHAVHAGRLILIALGVIVAVVAVVALVSRERWDRVNTRAFAATTALGSGLFLYGVAYVFSVYAAFAHNPTRLTVLLGAALTIAWRPVERLVLAFEGVRRADSQPAIVAHRVDDPATVVAHVRGAGEVRFGAEIRTAGGAVGVVVDMTNTTGMQVLRISFPPGTRVQVGERLDALTSGAPEEPIVGYVVRGTTLNSVSMGASIDISNTDIEEGRLLAGPVRGNEVLFQVTAVDVEDVRLGETNHARFKVEAQKLGVWSQESASFDLVPWLPNPGEPLRLKRREDAQFEPEGIGFVPGSRYAIRYRPIPAVTHNTAILGVLGSGKTTLASELLCRNVMGGVKVVVLDITGQYANLLAPLTSKADVEAHMANLNSKLAALETSTKRDADGYFGSQGELIRQFRKGFKNFLASSDSVRIFNPLALNGTTISGWVKSGQAEDLRPLSVIEKTSIIAQALLQEAAEQGETGDARVCLVIEEAHSLTPEPQDGLIKDDIRAVTSTARAVLQGRKYGMGCLLITQRTANVTKTILNQCHTIFALRSYDATGVAFLSNYFGARYSQLLSTLPQFHCVAFGSGISCSAPVIMKLNDPIEFRAQCWEPTAGALAQASPQAASPEPIDGGPAS